MVVGATVVVVDATVVVVGTTVVVVDATVVVVDATVVVVGGTGTATTADPVPVPPAFVPATVKVYETPLASPTTR